MRELVIIAVALLFGAHGTNAAPPEHARDAVKADDEADVVNTALLAAHNRERESENLKPLTLDPELSRIAKRHADDMAAHHKMAHEGSDGSTPVERLTRENYQCQTSGENIAFGWRRVDRVMKGWLDSPPHKKNILGAFTRVGFGVALDDDGVPYWAADFATPWPKLDSSTAGAELISAVNHFRVDEKKTSLRNRPKLATVAMKFATQFAKTETLDTGPMTIGDLATELHDVGYRYTQIAVTGSAGAISAEDVVANWLKNEPNREAILASFADAGAAVAASKTGRPFWCLILANPQK